MSNKNVYTICKNFDIKKQDIDGFLSYKKQIDNVKNNNNFSNDLYKAGSRYGTISLRDF